jgi:hypothetical protein
LFYCLREDIEAHVVMFCRWEHRSFSGDIGPASKKCMLGSTSITLANQNVLWWLMQEIETQTNMQLSFPCRILIQSGSGGLETKTSLVISRPHVKVSSNPTPKHHVFNAQREHTCETEACCRELLMESKKKSSVKASNLSA